MKALYCAKIAAKRQIIKGFMEQAVVCSADTDCAACVA